MKKIGILLLLLCTSTINAFEVVAKEHPKLKMVDDMLKHYKLDESTLDNFGYTKLDLFTMAFTIYGEARGEHLKGKYAVAHVLNNRAKFNKSSIVYEAFKNNQFTTWNINDANLKAITKAVQNYPNNWGELKVYFAISLRVMLGIHKDTTYEATHYYNPKLVTPYWSTSLEETVTIGNHRFMR